MTDGIYCLANDVVFDWMVAFLSSVRAAAPRLPVIVIPYDGRITRLTELRRVHPFDFWDNGGALRRMDAVGRAVNPRTPATFRKIAAFWGPFDRFLFADSDVVVSRGFDQALGAITETEMLCGDIDMNQVFLPSVLRREVEGSGLTSGFNTGFFASTRGALSEDEVLDAAAHAKPALPAFVAGAQEQPFLNWCVWRGGLRVRSISEAVEDASTYTGARRRPLRRYADGTIRVFDPGSDDFGRRMLVVHWAGFRCTSRMPNRRLFLHYRLGRTSVLEQAAFLSRWSLGGPKLVAAKVVNAARGSERG